MKKLIAVGILGLMAFFVARMNHLVHVQAQQNVWSKTVTNQYGTFTNSVTARIDPSVGADGTLYWTEILTGSPSNYMPSYVKHTPGGTAHLNGDGFTQPGTPVPANQSPNYSKTWTFDIATDCNNEFLDFGFCTGDGEATDFCPIANALFLDFLHGFEAEHAYTTFRVPAYGRNGDWTGQCSPPSSPPDYIGPFESPDTADFDRWYRTDSYVLRVCLHPPCTGELWISTGPNPRKYKQISDIQPPQHCTNADKGFVSGKNVTY